MKIRYADVLSNSREGSGKPQRMILITPSAIAAVCALVMVLVVLICGFGMARVSSAHRSADELRAALGDARKQHTELLERHEQLLLALPSGTTLGPDSVSYQAYIERFGDVASVHIRAAERFAAGDWEACEKLCRQLLSEEGLNEATRRDVTAKQAWSLFYLGQDDQALAHIAAALEAEPGSVALRQAQADMLLMRGDNQAARAVLDELRGQAPSPAVVFSLGNLAWATEAHDEAVRHFRFVLAHGNRRQERAAANNLALLYQQQGDTGRANVHLTMLLSLAPDSPTTLATAGRLMLRQNRLAEAEDFLSRAWTAAPQMPELASDLAELFERTGRSDAADDVRRLVNRAAAAPTP